MSKLKIIDLFCGCGGFSQGFEQAGYSTLLGVDMWADATSTYQYNFPNSKVINDDITKVSTKQLLDVAGISANDVDGIIGGPRVKAFQFRENE